MELKGLAICVQALESITALLALEEMCCDVSLDQRKVYLHNKDHHGPIGTAYFSLRYMTPLAVIFVPWLFLWPFRGWNGLGLDHWTFRGSYSISKGAFSPSATGKKKLAWEGDWQLRSVVGRESHQWIPVLNKPQPVSDAESTKYLSQAIGPTACL